jgi:SOS regulatory protein LexA
MRIKWLHLSDIHFNYKNYNSHSLREDFINRIESLVQNEPFTHLFISGDILYQNQEADSDTIIFIQKLISIMQISQENVFIVPGNHDHDRTQTDSILDELFKGSKRKDHANIIDNISKISALSLINSFQNYGNVYESLFEKSYYTDFDNPHIVVCTEQFSIIKLNTAWLDVNSTKKENYLTVGTRHLQIALSAYEEILNKTVNIAIGHHSLDDMTTEDRKKVLDQFERHNIGIYFCGHRHKPDIKYYRDNDVVEFVAPGGFNDGYSDGGYIWGIIDTDTDFYKAEIYGWYDNKWCIESKIGETDEYGIYYFHTNKLNHKSDIAAIDCKTMDGHIPIADLEKALGKNFDIHTYNGPTENTNSYNEDTIKDFAKNIINLVEKNKSVHIFPLAPIPMLIDLGFNLQDNSNIIIHQYDRANHIWVLNGSNQKDKKFKFDGPICDTKKSEILALAISTSFSVDESQIERVFQNKIYDLVRFTAADPRPGYPIYKDDINACLEKIMDFLNSNVNKYNEIHLFAAIPAGMAIEFGRRMLSTVYSNIYTYQLDKSEYYQKLVINPKVSDGKTNHTENSNIVFVENYNNNICNLPLVGGIACGSPDEGYIENEKFFPLTMSILGNGDFFVVQAKGDSMIEANIEEDDYVIIRRQNTAENGQIVIALIDGETTLKRFYRDDEHKRIILHPENENYRDMIFKELEIQGVAVHVIKSL